jgi:hypothetical protein
MESRNDGALLGQSTVAVGLRSRENRADDRITGGRLAVAASVDDASYSCDSSKKNGGEN